MCKVATSLIPIFFLTGEMYKGIIVAGLSVILLFQPLNGLGMQISVRPLQNGLVLRTLQTQSCHAWTSVSPQCICNLFLLFPQTQLHLLALLLADWQVPSEDGRWNDMMTKWNSNEWLGGWLQFFCRTNLREMTWPSSISICAWCSALRWSW